MPVQDLLEKDWSRFDIHKTTQQEIDEIEEPVAELILRCWNTGIGQYFDLSQYECGLQFVAPALLEAQIDGRSMGRSGNRDPLAAPHGCYPCRGDDAWCVIAVSEEDEWKALCQAVGHPEWRRDPRFADLQLRKKNEDDLDLFLSEWTSRFTPLEVMEALQRASVSSGAVKTVAELFECPQLQQRQQWQALAHPELESYEYEAPPFLLSETPARLDRPSPCLGEHNDYVFGEILGMPEDQLKALQDEKVIY